MVSQVLRGTHSAAQPTAATYKTTTMIGSSALVISVAVGIEMPSQALAAILPTPMATGSFQDDRPFCFLVGHGHAAGRLSQALIDRAQSTDLLARTAAACALIAQMRAEDNHLVG